MRFIKRITDKTIAIAIIIALTVAFMFGAFSLSYFGAGAKAEDTAEFEPSSIEISNTNFSDASGSAPASPTSWTGEVVGDGASNVIAGVVDLDPSAYVGSDGGNKKFKLDQYPEYATEDKIPYTIFGPNSDYKDSSTKALMINSENGAETAYAYSSSEFTFVPNSFYRISVWVKTGDFASNTGATIKLSGLDGQCGFFAINTVAGFEKADGAPVLNQANNYGWDKYTIYVRSSAYKSQTAKLILGIGDAITTSDNDETIYTPRLATGYAFFDTITAERISAKDFAFDTTDFTPGVADNIYYDANGTAMLYDLFDTEYLSIGSTEIGTFSDNTDLWNMNAVYDSDSENGSYAGQSTAKIYNSYASVDVENKEDGFTQNPWAPLGRAEDKTFIDNPLFEGTNGNILVISTYNSAKKEFDSSARGVASPDFVIERFKYYRFSAWVKSDGVTGGNGVSIAIRGQSNNTADNNKLDQWYNNLSGDDTDTAHYGWTEKTVYIKGSSLSDLTVHVELWLGTPNSMSGGIAMFDNISLVELSSAEYSDNSSSGDTLTLDASASETGVSNGNFMSAESYNDGEFPLSPSSWTYKTAATVVTAGFSNADVDTDNAKYGMIPVDSYFNNISAGLPGVNNPSDFANPALYNVLLLSSTTNTAFCYQSSDITLTVDKAYKITVDMAVDGVSGYGASLVLKNSNDTVISTIENITTTNNAFKTYTFYIEAPLAAQNVKLEVWLGLNDRLNNTQKLSSGNVYVKEVSLVEWTEDSSSGLTLAAEYKKLVEKYAADVASPAYKALDYGVYSFSAPVFDYYDIYSYNNNGSYATPYGWSVSTLDSASSKVGVFNTENMNDITLNGFDKKDQSGNMLLIYNTMPTRTTVTYDNTLSIVSNTYYRLDVTVKLRLSEAAMENENAIGATISITGTKTESFENIKDTTTLIAEGREDSRDVETFKTFTFYISGGSDGGDIGLTISLGGDTRSSYIDGQLIVANINFSSINNTVYESAAEALDETYERAVSLSEASEEDDSNKEAETGDIAWWIIPTVIFSSALVIAIIIIIVMRIRDHFKKKKSVTYSSEYDRTSIADDIERLQREGEAGAEKPTAPAPADDLDDDMAVAPEAPAQEEPQTPEEEQTPDEESQEMQAEPEEKPTAPAPAEDLDD